MDDKTKELVLAINKIGVKTLKSCQGHSGSDFHYSFPWIAFYGSRELNLLKIIILRYNKNQRNEKWEIVFAEKVENNKPIYILRPKNHYKELSFLQKEASVLADYLKNMSPKSCFY